MFGMDADGHEVCDVAKRQGILLAKPTNMKGQGRMRKTPLLIVAIAATLVLGACSSSKGTSASGTGAAGAGAGSGTSAAGGDTSPVNIAVLGQFAAPSFAYPEIPLIIQAHVDVVNAAGGVNGHQIKIVVCNDQGTQAGAVSCARDATTSNSVAVLTGYTRYGTAVLPLLEQAGMSMVGNLPLTPDDYSSKASFPGSGAQGLAVAAVQKLMKDGCKNVAFIHWDSPSGALAKPTLQKLVTDAGGKFIDENEGATGTSDYGPVAAAIRDAGANCALSFLPATDAIKWITAQRQLSPGFPIAATYGATPASVLTALGAAGNGLILANGSPDVNDTSNTEIAEFHSEMAAKGVSAASLTPVGLEAWAGTKLLLGAIKSISGKVDKASVTKAMNNITAPATTLLGSYDTTKPNSQAAFAHYFDTDVYLFTVQDRKLVPLGPPTNVRALFN